MALLCRGRPVAAPGRPHVKPKGPSGLAATLFWTRRLGGRPRLIVDSDDWEGPGGWNDHPAAGYSEGQKRFFEWQEKYGLSHADAWTVTSACLRDRAVGLGARPEDVYVLHNGVEAVRDQVSSRNLVSPTNPASPHPRILLYTRFAGVRPDDVADIWGRVRSLVPDATLTVVGRGSQGEEMKLAALPGVEVAGWLEPDEVQRALAGAHLAIAPWANTATNRARHSAKILELMAAGVPVVAYDVGEMAATLGDAGLIVPAGDALGFAGATAGLLQDAERREAMGMIARERVQRLFSWDALADAALAAYRA